MHHHHSSTNRRRSRAKQDSVRSQEQGQDPEDASWTEDSNLVMQAMSITMIEDDDLMFGGKPLCTWYEEGRRRYSGADNTSGVPSPNSSVEDEELHRGRQRDRPQYPKSVHKHKKTMSSSGKTSDKQHGNGSQH